MKRIASIATAFAVLMSSGAMAEDEGGKEKKEKKVCRTEKVTGSLTRVNRICMTQAEWDELARSSKQGLDDFVSRDSGTVPRDRGVLPGN